MSEDYGEFSLGQLLGFYQRWAGKILGVSMLVGVLAAAVIFTLPRSYSSHFSVFATGLNNVPAEAQVQMQMAALFGLSSGGTEYVTAVLESDLIQLEVIERLQLRENSDFWWGSFEPDRTPKNTLKRLRKLMNLRGPQPPLMGALTLSIKSISPELSFQIAGEFLRLLNDRMERESKRRSAFMEEQLKASEIELERAGEALKAFAETEEIAVPLEIQGKEEFTALVELKTQKIIAEAELKALKGRLDAPGDVRVQMFLRSEIAGLESKLSELNLVMEEGEAMLRDLPSQTKRYADLVRDYKTSEKIFALYREHYELARVYEIGKAETRPYRVIDEPYQAIEPDKRHGALKLLAALIFGGLLGLSWALFQEALKVARLEQSRSNITFEDPEG